MGMINGKTGLLGLLGNPVEHSLSPAMQNAALAQMGINWCYMPIPCQQKDLKIILQSLRAINCHGLNVTIPHKNEISKLCLELSPLAKRLGAVNTLIPSQKDGWTGSNTDVEGFITPLLKTEENWKGRNAMVLGTGGSAKAVIAGLKELDLSNITVIGRNKKRLMDFVKDMNTNLSDYPSADNKSLITGALEENPEIIETIKRSDLVVNATPIGMKSNNSDNDVSKNIPLNNELWKNLKSNSTLYDLIYTPRPTEWLLLGKQQGCTSIDGLEMLIQQGASSLSLWTQQNDIPLKTMEIAAKKALLN